MVDTSNGIHVTTHPSGTGWASIAKNVVLSSHKTKTAAFDEGRILAKRHGQQLTIHRRDGAVTATHSYERTPV
jgi:hypothetical protein